MLHARPPSYDVRLSRTYDSLSLRIPFFSPGLCCFERISGLEGERLSIIFVGPVISFIKEKTEREEPARNRRFMNYTKETYIICNPLSSNHEIIAQDIVAR